MAVTRSAPARFCVVVPMEDGRSFEAFCIACHWLRVRKTRAAAESAAARHECPRPKEGTP